MCSTIAIALLALVVQAHATIEDSNSGLVESLTHHVFHRLDHGWSADLEHTTFGTPRQSARLSCTDFLCKRRSGPSLQLRSPLPQRGCNIICAAYREAKRARSAAVWSPSRRQTKVALLGWFTTAGSLSEGAASVAIAKRRSAQRLAARPAGGAKKDVNLAPAPEHKPAILK